MKRYVCIWTALLCLLAGASMAANLEREGIAFSTAKPELIKNVYQAGRMSFELYARNAVDVGALVEDIDLERTTSAQAIADRVNEKRKALCPDEEMILSIGPSPKLAHVTGDSSLVRAIFWWNNSNCSTCYWYAQYTSNVATVFVDDIKGSYKLSELVGSSGYVLRYILNAGGAGTRATFGTTVLRGFKGNANGVASKADIVIYFFK